MDWRVGDALVCTVERQKKFEGYRYRKVRSFFAPRSRGRLGRKTNSRRGRVEPASGQRAIKHLGGETEDGRKHTETGRLDHQTPDEDEGDA